MSETLGLRLEKGQKPDNAFMKLLSFIVNVPLLNLKVPKVVIVVNPSHFQ